MGDVKTAKKVAVIGAGASGLPTLKSCLEYGLQVACFEKTSDLGGLWRFKPKNCEGEGSVMRSTIMNTSKEMMAFSDFPPPSNFATFMHNERVLEYFRMYAEQFKLLPHIRFNTVVTKVEKAPDYDKTGRWIVSSVNSIPRERSVVQQSGFFESSSAFEETFDAVFICSGHHVDPHIPHFMNEDKFKGNIIHAITYKDNVDYIGKRVIVVGVGNSGADIAVELSRVCSQVYMVTRRGTWVFNRIDRNGDPLDMNSTTRFNAFLGRAFPKIAIHRLEQKLNKRFDHQAYGLRPPHPVSAQPPTVNDELPGRLACGAIAVKPLIQEFADNGHTVTFADGTHVRRIDTVILATGYTIRFPMFGENDDIVQVIENECTLYKHMYPPNLRYPTLAIIGLVQPIGAFAPISEMQARVACEFLVGVAQIPFPTRTDMLEEIARKREALRSRYIESRRSTIQVDYVPFMDELAELIGCKPLTGLGASFRNPRLAHAIRFGPTVSYQYRLQGKHTWSGAPEAIFSAWQRSRAGLRSGEKAMRLMSAPSVP